MLLVLIFTRGWVDGWKECVTEKSSDTTGNRSRDRPTSSAAPYPLRHPKPRRNISTTCVCVCVCVCIYIYIYIYKHTKTSIKRNVLTIKKIHLEVGRAKDLSAPRYRLSRFVKAGNLLNKRITVNKSRKRLDLEIGCYYNPCICTKSVNITAQFYHDMLPNYHPWGL